MAGQEAAQAEQERNMLRQQQAEQMQFQRENMLAQQEQRRAQAAALTDAAARRNALAAYVRGGMPQGAAGLVEFGEEGFKAAEALRKERLATLEEAQKVLGYATQRLAGVKSPESYAAVRAELGRLSPDFANAMPAEYDPAQLDVLVKQGLSLKDQLELAKPTVVATGASVYQPGKGFVGTAPAAPVKPTPAETEEIVMRLQDPSLPPASRQALEARLRILTTREPKEPREQQPQAPVAVVDPATGRPVLVSREEALAGRMTPAAAMEGLTPKERQNREAKFPQATSAVKTFETTSNTLIKDLETLSKHPGLGSITGIAAGRLPGITSAGREAEALFDKIVARGGFQELQNMRQASPTGGALGNVSNQEGAQLRQAFAALDRRQDAGSVRKAITDAIGQIRTSQQTIKDAYDMTYEYKQGGGAAPAATKSGATVSNW
jgi:hypothetical protein